MNKLKMHTPDLAAENYAKLAKLFPNAITETIVGYEPVLDKDGNPVIGLDGAPKERPIIERAVDPEILQQEINTRVLSDKEERYQFTWPDKRKSVVLANAPINATLRPCREESVNFDTTENLYIEGDNLDVLKLLRETYLGKVKMIYIDPPYNTGNDFIYPDDFSESIGSFLERDGQYDGDGNRMIRNLDSNGRFHTDWLNMIYPRLRFARDLLTDDGVIFISIDDGEVQNLKKTCCEIFGSDNVVASLARKTKTTSNNGSQFAPSHEYIIVCAKNINDLNTFSDPEAQESEEYIKLFKYEDDYGKYNTIGLYQPALKHGGSRYYIVCPDGSKVITPNNLPWRWNEQTFLSKKAENRVVFLQTKTSPLIDENGNQAKWNIYTKLYLKDRLESGMRPISFIDKYPNSEASKELLKMEIPFTFSKPRRLIQYLIKICGTEDDSIILDFFSGSATTAHAVMQHNAEDGGNRKFIMIQIPEECDEKSEAYKAGYKNICEIGKERIRRAGRKIVDENPLERDNLDIGFRVLKLDSGNMKDVYYTPEDYAQMSFMLDGFVDNIKEDRTDEDLLFQVMLDLGIPLSAKIHREGRTYYVDDNYLVACFGSVDTGLITEIAKKQPYYAVFRDSGFADDSAMVNFEQVFATYSPDTIRRIL